MDSIKTLITGSVGMASSVSANALIPPTGDEIENGIRIGVQIIIGLVTLIQLIKERRKERKFKKSK